MAVEAIRIGIVGAGANTRLRHIPGFRATLGVEIVGVVNSTPESTKRAAQELGITRTFPDWQALVADDRLDAVMIGTWPNLHCEVTCAALDAGKHVLTEARMARNAVEAKQMLDASQRHPDLIAQIVPSPFGLVEHQFVLDLIADGFLGDLRELVVLGADDSFYDNSKPLHWRQDKHISGSNILAMGILHETAIRWTPPPTRVFAQTTICDRVRPTDDKSGTAAVTVPDSVQILTELHGGARGLYHLSGIELFGPGRQIHMYGSLGTIKAEFAAQTRLLIGRAGDTELRAVDVPPEKRGGWRVEAEFIGAIRSEEKIRFTDFATGVRYMEFTAAVSESAKTGRPVNLPL